MSTSPPWHRIVRDPAVLRRAILTSLGVGTVLTAVNNVEELTSGTPLEHRLVPIAITYIVPFFVSILSSIVALVVERRDRGSAVQYLEREIEAIVRFPGQNPNPVLRVGNDGVLTYANESSAPIRSALGLAVGEAVPSDWMTQIRAAAAGSPPGRLEVEHDRQAFAVLPVWVDDLGVYNLYGTDVTGAKVVERFPDRNPNPVLRMTLDGRLQYANAASEGITRALGLSRGDRLPDDLIAEIQATLAGGAASPPEVHGEGRTFRLRPVLIPEFDFVNLYGTDVTALLAVDKFPNENPNPVLRLDREGRLTYANPSSFLVRQALGADVGEQLDQDMFRRIVDALADDAAGMFELEADGRIFSLRVVQVYEFESINLYGTDITAARQVEALSEANRRLLENILPPSIAERLRGGEGVIADRFDDMAVLFADIVGFTELSARLEPAQVIDLLNEVFRMCDELAERFGLEKIKTIGDAYMVVGSISRSDRRTSDAEALGGGQPISSRSEQVADMGLAMLDELSGFRARTGLPIELRLGMHVGPAVGGVIGLRKYFYDVWGDTVNTASRMESTGLPGRIQVSRETYERLRGAFEFERRGLVDVKGKGRIETWFLVARRRNGDAVGAGRDPAEAAELARGSG